MRALVCSRLDGPESLQVGELPAPDLVPRSVRIRVEAAGVNFPDILMTSGMYQHQPSLPFAPGLEAAGTVVEVAEGVTTTALGERVFASVPNGAFAEEVVVDADSVFPTPADMPAEIAAAFLVAYGTGYHALVDRARLAAGESLLVLGAAGGVGLAAVQIGATLGARVIAAVSSAEKEDAVRRSGAKDVIRYDHQDLREGLKALVAGGVDVVYDPVGGSMTEAAFRSTAWGGRHLVIGFASGEIPSLAANLALLKGASLVGVFWGRFAQTEPEANRRNFETLAGWWSEGRIRPVVSGTYSLGEAMEALHLLRTRGAIGKLVVRL